MDIQTNKHESYGMIQITRGQSSGQHLFGSSIEHHHTINISIMEGEHHRDLNRDWYYGHKAIVEIMLSPTQFADAITSIGSPSPCTIRYRMDKGGMEKPPFESKIRQFNNEFEKDMKEIASKCDALIKEAQERKLPKSIQHQLAMLRQDLASNIPFVNQSFSEQMENTVKEAKGEVEAFISHKVHSLGLEALREQLPTINETKLLNNKEVE
jgi:Skp family chaperone for outer membrane proteins